jgi:hypothetical protein
MGSVEIPKEVARFLFSPSRRDRPEEVATVFLLVVSGGIPTSWQRRSVSSPLQSRATDFVLFSLAGDPSAA